MSKRTRRRTRTGARLDRRTERLVRGGGEAARYELHEELVAGPFRPRETRTADLARVLADLAAGDDVWARWQRRVPVIADTPRG